MPRLRPCFAVGRLSGEHRHDLHPCAVRPRDGLALRRDGEREVVQDLVKRFRDLPAEQQRRLPALLNSLAQLEVVVGDIEAGQHDFQEVARLVADPISQAEAHHNVYRAALERRDWNEALAALRRAAALDADAFEPFPLGPLRADPHPRRRRLRRLLPLPRPRGSATHPLAKSSSRRCGPTPSTATSTPSSASRGWMQELDHPALIRVRDAPGPTPRRARPYLVLEYFEGQTLTDHVAQHGPLAPEDWLAVAWQIGRALQALHGRGDVAPQPPAVRRAGPPEKNAEGKDRWRVKLLDAGLSLKRTVIHASASNPAARVQTALGRSVARTIAYAAPEVVGKPKGQVWVGPHSDVYAFGKLAAFALTGRPDPDGGDLVLLAGAVEATARRPHRLDHPRTGRRTSAPCWTGCRTCRAAGDRQRPGRARDVRIDHRRPHGRPGWPTRRTSPPWSTAATPTPARATSSRPSPTTAGRSQLRPDDAALYRRRGLAHARARPTTRPSPTTPRRSELRAAQPGGAGQPRPGPRPAQGARPGHCGLYRGACVSIRKDEALYYNRGNAHYCKAEYDRAVADYSEAVRLDPRNAWAFGNRGKAHALRGEHGRAVADFGRVLHLDPANVKAIWDRALSYVELGQYDKALADYDAAIRLEPSAALYLERGQARAAVGDLEQAVADFTEALALDPKHVGAYLARAGAYQDTRRVSAGAGRSRRGAEAATRFGGRAGAGAARALPDSGRTPRPWPTAPDRWN